MNSKGPIWLLSILLLAIATPMVAHEAHCKDTPLGATMADMKKPYKALRKAIRDQAPPRYQALAKELLALSEKARDQSPLLVTEKKRNYAKYQDKMDEQISLLRELSISKPEQAPALLDQLQALRKQGHKRFRKECD